MTEDEDVLFEGHELQRYLNEQGFTDFEVVHINGTAQGLRNGSTGIKVQKLWSTIKGFVSPLHPKGWFSNYKDTVYLLLEVEVILNSGLLLEEDSHFLENIALPINYTDEKPLWTEISLLYGIFVCGTMFMWKKQVLHGILPVMYSLLTAEHFLRKWNLSVQRSMMSGLVKKLLNCSQELYALQKKSLHFVQENEVLFRGFTLAKSSSSSMQLEVPLTSSLAKNWYIMSGLRMSITQSALDAISVLQTATRNLLTCCPLTGQLDKGSHYIAFLSMEGLGIAGVESSNASKLTLVILKQLHQTYLHLQSEFLRRLACCFVPQLWKNSEQDVEQVFVVINEVLEKFDNNASRLGVEYKLFSCYGLVPERKNSQNKMIKKNDWKGFGIYVGLHSAHLHLQGMLHKTQELEEQLQSDEFETEIGRSEEFFQNLTDIITELSSCRNCLEVAVDNIQLLNRPIIPLIEPPPSPVSSELPMKREAIPVGFTDLDPQVEDEVFEAFITCDPLYTDVDDYDFECLTEADKIGREIEKEHSERMMRELKTVLVHKASEWAQREAKALKNKSITVTDVAELDREVETEDDPLKLSETLNANHCQDETNLSDVGADESLDSSVRTRENKKCEMSDIFPETSTTANWPLPRLKTGRPFTSSKISRTLRDPEGLNNDPEQMVQVKTLIVGASTVRPNFIQDVEEETFCASGENSSSDSD